MSASKTKARVSNQRAARESIVHDLVGDEERKKSIAPGSPAISPAARGVFTADKVKTLMEAEDVDQLEARLSDILSLKNLAYDLKDGILLDYYVAAIWWSKCQNYNLEQTLAFYSIIEAVIQNTENKMSLADNMKELNRLLSGLKGVVSPTETEHFDVQEISTLACYLYTSLFQHYRLYLLSLGECQQGHIEGLDLFVETPTQPLCPAPLCEAMPDVLYNDRVLQKTEIGKKTASETLEETIKDNDLLSRVSPEEVKLIMGEVFTEMLVGLSADVAEKMRLKEAEFLERINCIYVSQT